MQRMGSALASLRAPRPHSRLATPGCAGASAAAMTAHPRGDKEYAGCLPRDQGYLLGEPAHPPGEPPRGGSELCGARFDLLPQHDHGTDLLVGDLVRVEERRLERLPLQ
jgi:hypothetical protein